MVRSESAIYFLSIKREEKLEVVELGVYKNGINGEFDFMGIGKYGV